MYLLRRLILAAALLIVLICTPDASGDGKEVTLTFWQFSVKDEILSDLIEQFERENPHITVKAQTLTWDYGLDKIVTSLAAKNAPDVFELGSTWLPQFIDSDALYDLTPDFKDVKDEYIFWEPVVRGQKIYGAPWLLGTRVLFYNKDLFEEAGLKPDKPPQNWNELIESAARINALSAETYGFAIYVGEEYTPWQEFLPFVWSRGGSVLSADYTRAEFSSSEVRDTFRFYRELKKHSFIERQSQVNKSFAEGKVGMQISGAWNLLLIPRINPALDYGVALVPGYDEASERVSFGGGEMLVINKDTARPDAARKFLKFLLREENMMRVVRAQKNVVPSYEASIRLPYFKDNQKYRVMFEQMKLSRPAPSHPEWITIQKELSAAIDDFILKDANLDTIVERTQSRIEEIIRQKDHKPTFGDKLITAGLIIIVLAAAVVFAVVKKIKASKDKAINTRAKKVFSSYILLSPWLLIFLVFGLYPLVYSIVISFSEYHLLTSKISLVGLANYINILKDPAFHKALLNTSIFAVGTVPFNIILALIAAILINHRIPGKQFFQAGLFLPVATSVIVIASIFTYIYSPYGPLNSLLREIGINPPDPNWLLNTKLALPAIMAMSVWASFGYYTILFVAGLQAIPESLYEVSAIDGANRWQQIWYVTLSQLRGIILFAVVINTIRTFQVFPEIFTMTKGGPANSTITVVYYLYEQGFHNFAMGKASAVGYILFVIILLFTLVQMKVLGFEKKMTY